MAPRDFGIVVKEKLDYLILGNGKGNYEEDKCHIWNLLQVL